MTLAEAGKPEAGQLSGLLARFPWLQRLSSNGYRVTAIECAGFSPESKPPLAPIMATCHASATCPKDIEACAWYDIQAEDALVGRPGYDGGLTLRQAWNTFFDRSWRRPVHRGRSFKNLFTI